MHLRIIWAIVRKDALDIWTNKSTLVGLIYPIIMSLVFFLISRTVGSSGPNVIIYDPGNSSLVPAFVKAFSSYKVTPAASGEQVKENFGSNGARVKSAYAIGLILPKDFDTSLRSGNKPEISIFFNGTTTNPQTQLVIQTFIINYARTIASPQPPVTFNTVVINPHNTTNTAQILGQVYTPIVLLLSLIIGTTFIPTLLIEEKEKKTLRMLLVTPATFKDILLGKLLIVLFFQLVISCVVLAIQGGFTGQVGLVLFYVLLGSCFSLSLGLFFGSIFNTVSAAGTFAGMVSIVYILGGLFVGQFGQIFGNGAISTIAKLLPTYYLAEGVVNAVQKLGTLQSNILDSGIILVSTILLFAIASWILRRQSSVLAMI